jgi:DNA-binding NarL/FixJ family response regulator
MPRMNGIAAAPELKKLLPRTPIVLFTSYHAALGNFDVRGAGIDAVVAKGGDMCILAKSIHDLLQLDSTNNPSV